MNKSRIMIFIVISIFLLLFSCDLQDTSSGYNKELSGVKIYQ